MRTKIYSDMIYWMSVCGKIEALSRELGFTKATVLDVLDVRLIRKQLKSYGLISEV